MGRLRKPIRDKTTGKEYPSQYSAGLHLYRLVGGDPADRHVWFKIARAFPGRFQTLVDGQWVDVDYDTSGRDRALSGAAVAEATAPYDAPLRKTTTVEIDVAKLGRVKDILETTTLRETIDRAFDEVIMRAAREKSIHQLQTMEGLDLNDPKVMADAWR